MRKIIVILSIIILLFLLALTYFSDSMSLFGFSLHGQPCGGSKIKPKECISGFTCKFSFPECDGCGGVCVPNK